MANDGNSISRRLQVAGSALTDDELRIAAEAEIDLGVGYPEFSLPGWLAELWYDLPLSELTWRYLDCTPGVDLIPGQSLPRSSSLMHQLCLAMLRYLNLNPDLVDNTFVTYSGSHALERSFATLIEPGTLAVTTTPSIDIIRAMLLERGDVRIQHVRADPEDGFSVPIASLCKAIEADDAVLVLTSPENPTGHVYSESDLKRLSEACRRTGTPFVLDQCFCMVSPSGLAVPLLPAFSDPAPSYLFVWDTGKTFDLDDDKLGFVVTSGDLAARFRERLAVLQCTLPKRKLMLMKLVLDGASAHHYGDILTEIVSDNLREVVLSVADTGITALVPDAGGFVLLDVSKLGMTGVEFSEELLAQKSVGAVPASSFFHDDIDGNLASRYVRIALIRDRHELRRGMHRVREFARYLAARS